MTYTLSLRVMFKLITAKDVLFKFTEMFVEVLLVSPARFSDVVIILPKVVCVI